MGIEQTNLAQLMFWAAAVILVYVYAGYPLLLTLLTPFFRKPARKEGYCPRLTVLIAAYNEAANIRRKIEETLALEYPRELLEVIIVSDGSTDGTDEIVNGCRDPRVKLIRIPERKGKTYAQNAGVGASTGEVVVFSDATAVYHRKALSYLASHYQDAEVGAVSGRYDYFDPGGKSPTGLGSVAFWSYENAIKSMQSRIHTLTGCSGCIYSVRKSLYTPLPAYACSDLVEPLRVVEKGYRVLLEDRALAYEETTKSTADEFHMRVRVAAHGIMGLASAGRLFRFWQYGWVTFQLLSHKVLRWFVPFLLIAVFASSAALRDLPGYRQVFFFQLFFYGFVLFSSLVPLHRRWKPLGLPLYFCTINAAALVSVFELLRGQKFVVWEPVRK